MHLHSQTDSGLSVELASVSKWYGPVIGVNSISAVIEPGITGILGANGAGKSTLLKLISGQIRPSQGRVLVGKHQAGSAAARLAVGYCPDGDAAYSEMSAERFIYCMARLRGLGRRLARDQTDLVLNEVGLHQGRDRPIRTYSKGMRQRTKLAQALLGDPKVLVLDEPLNGVDPIGRKDFCSFFLQWAQAGRVVLVSSHVLHEMEKIAQRVLFIGKGRLVASGTISELRSMLEQFPVRLEVRSDRIRELAGRLLRLELVRSVEFQEGGAMLVQTSYPQEFYGEFQAIVLDGRFEIQELRAVDGSAEAVFDYIMSEF